jgi:hypothetical protein
MDEAQQLEDKLKVAMAGVLSVRGEVDAGDEDAIEQISQTGETAIARSIDWEASQRRRPTELVGIKHSGGAVTM